MLVYDDVVWVGCKRVSFGQLILVNLKHARRSAVSKTIEEVREEQQAISSRHAELQQELKQLEARWNYLLGQAELLAPEVKEEE